jgi:hypothetical protein
VTARRDDRDSEEQLAAGNGQPAAGSEQNGGDGDREIRQQGVRPLSLTDSAVEKRARG